MDKVVIYIHGKGGSAEEAKHYELLFEACDVIGFDYSAQSPWEAKEEFPKFFDAVCKNYKSAAVVASSIGAFFAMHSLADKQIERAYFISPVVNMEKLIANMMTWANVTEAELREKKEIPTDFGETLSWEYLCYVRENPVKWAVPTDILYGEKDNLTSYETMSEFANKVNASLTVMKGGEHWFHTEEQMKFLDEWIKRLEKGGLSTNGYTYIALREKPQLIDVAASWFHDKWKVPKEAYLECMKSYLEHETEYGWFLCMDGGKIIGGLGVIENDFHNRKDLAPNICAVYTKKDYRGRGIAGHLLDMAVNDLKSKNITPVYLITDHTGFYEKYGWKFLCMVQSDDAPVMSRMYIHE